MKEFMKYVGWYHFAYCFGLLLSWWVDKSMGFEVPREFFAAAATVAYLLCWVVCVCHFLFNELAVEDDEDYYGGAEQGGDDMEEDRE